MKAEKCHELSQFQKISQQMLEFAEADEWDKLSDLEKKRKTLMQSFFAQPVSPEDSVDIRRVIESVLTINDKITQLAGQHKGAISLQLQELKKRQNVQSAYMQNK